MVNGHEKRTVKQWLQYIQELHPKSIDMGLERVHIVKSRLNFSHRPIVFVVAGTNGKGSTCTYLQAFFQHQNITTGLYTSPHIVNFNERIALNGKAVADIDLVAAFAAVENKRGDVSLTYFEFSTLAAWCVFEKHQPQVVILEVGMGGRLDAVNAFDSDCAVITSISYDHVQHLGTTRASIGYEKSGIMRAGKPAIISEPDPPMALTNHAHHVGAVLYRYGVDYGVKSVPKCGWWLWQRQSPTLSVLPNTVMPGSQQTRNMATAIVAIKCLQANIEQQIGRQFNLSESIAHVAQQASCSGRFQILPTTPLTILDVGHNQEASLEISTNLRAQKGQGRVWAVFGLVDDKDGAAIIDALHEDIYCWLPVTLPKPRGCSGADLLEMLKRKGVRALNSFPTPTDAYYFAKSQASAEDRILVFGSFLTVGDVMRSTELSHMLSNNIHRYVFN